MIRPLFGAVLAALALLTGTARATETFRCFDREKGIARIFSLDAPVRPTGAEYPWMINLWYDDPGHRLTGPFCGGVLINTDLVLTAAHCLPPVPFSVRRVTESGSAEGPRRAVVATAVHPRYLDWWEAGTTPRERMRGLDFDIALLRLDRPFDIAPLDIPRLLDPASAFDDYHAHDGDCARVIGWGRTENVHGAAASDRLLGVDLRLWSRRACQNAWRYEDGAERSAITEDKVCAGYATGQRDACSGDSGGPLFVRGGPSGVYLVGLVSYGPPECGSSERPGVYVNLRHFHTWISTASAAL